MCIRDRENKLLVINILLAVILGLLFFGCRLGYIYGILYQDGFGPKENPARAIGAMGSWALMAIAALMCIF